MKRMSVEEKFFVVLFPLSTSPFMILGEELQSYFLVLLVFNC